MRLARWIFFLLMLLPGSSVAAGSSGMLFGSDHAFYFTAPKGWVLDNQSGVRQGLHMVFYPAGQTWKGTPVIAYGMAVSKNQEVRSAEDQVRLTVDEFRSNGNNEYTAEAKGEVSIPDGRTAKIYFFHGDQWGNYEAAGYIDEKKTINFLVFNARNKADFEIYLPAFKAILASYKNSYSPRSESEDERFSKLVSEAKSFENTEEGAAYSAKFFQTYGTPLADIMKSCTSYTTKGQETHFELLLRVKPNGELAETLIRPANSLTTCVRGLVQDSHHPPHQLESVLIYINMSVKE